MTSNKILFKPWFWCFTIESKNENGGAIYNNDGVVHVWVEICPP
jgi:hypothetical protein